MHALPRFGTRPVPIFRSHKQSGVHSLHRLAGWLAGCVAPVAMEANSRAENSLCVHSTEAVEQNIQAHAGTHTCMQANIRMQPGNSAEYGVPLMYSVNT